MIANKHVKEVNKNLQNLKHIKKVRQNKHMKAETKQTNKNLGFWAMASCMLEQAYVCIIKPACTGKIMHMQVLS